MTAKVEHSQAERWEVASYKVVPVSLRGPFNKNGIFETPCWVYVPNHGVHADTFRLYQAEDPSQEPDGAFEGWAQHPTHFIALPKPNPPQLFSSTAGDRKKGK